MALSFANLVRMAMFTLTMCANNAQNLIAKLVLALILAIVQNALMGTTIQIKKLAKLVMWQIAYFAVQLTTVYLVLLNTKLTLLSSHTFAHVAQI